jgi:hypothetical protein
LGIDLDRVVTPGTNDSALKKGAILNQRGFRGLENDFVHEAKLKNSFVHSTKPEKGFDF